MQCNLAEMRLLVFFYYCLFPPAVSLIAFTAMALLAFFEFFVYRDTWMKYDYEVDKDFSRYAVPVASHDC